MDCLFLLQEADMTIEEQKYLEECRKKLGADQIEVIQMAFQYGLGIKDVRRVAIPKLNAEQMRQTVFACLLYTSEP